MRGASRVLQAISGDKLTLDNRLNALMADSLAWLVWSKTIDAEHNRNKPASIYDIITGKAQTTNNNESARFKTSAEFEEARTQILKGI